MVVSAQGERGSASWRVETRALPYRPCQTLPARSTLPPLCALHAHSSHTSQGFRSLRTTGTADSMLRGAPLAALTLLALAVAVLPYSSAIRVDNDAIHGDFDDHDLPHEENHEDEYEGEEDDEVDLDFGPGRYMKRLKVPRGEDDDWDLEKLLRSDEAFPWDHGISEDNYEEMLSKYSSEAPEDLDDWD